MVEEAPIPKTELVDLAGPVRKDAGIFAGVVGDIDEFFPKVKPTGEELKPWHQQDDEPNSWYMRFLIFLNIGPTRTISLACQKDLERKGKKVGKYRKTQGNWYINSKKFQWAVRAQAWDVEQIRRERLANEKHVKDARARHLTLAKNIQLIGNKVLKAHESPESIKKIKAIDATKMIVEGAKLELLALNRPTEIVGVEVKTEVSVNLEALSIEELVNLRGLVEKATPKKLEPRQEPRQAEVVVVDQGKVEEPTEPQPQLEPNQPINFPTTGAAI